jgi:hypothetical protein
MWTYMGHVVQGEMAKRTYGRPIARKCTRLMQLWCKRPESLHISWQVGACPATRTLPPGLGDAQQRAEPAAFRETPVEVREQLRACFNHIADAQCDGAHSRYALHLKSHGRS